MSQLHNPHLSSLLTQCKEMLINMNSKLDTLLKIVPDTQPPEYIYETPRKSNTKHLPPTQSQSAEMIQLQQRVNTQIKKYSQVKGLIKRMKSNT